MKKIIYGINIILLIVACYASYKYWSNENKGCLVVTTYDYPIIIETNGEKSKTIQPADTTIRYLFEIGKYDFTFWRVEGEKIMAQLPLRLAKQKIKRKEDIQVHAKFQDYGSFVLETKGVDSCILSGYPYRYTVREGKQPFFVPKGNYTLQLAINEENWYWNYQKDIKVVDGEEPRTYDLVYDKEKQILQVQQAYWQLRSVHIDPSILTTIARDTTGSNQLCQEGWRVPYLHEWKALMNTMNIYWQSYLEDDYAYLSSETTALGGLFDMEIRTKDLEYNSKLLYNNYFGKNVFLLARNQKDEYRYVAYQPHNGFVIIQRTYRIPTTEDIRCYCIKDELSS